MMRFKEVALSSASPEAKIAGLAVLLDKELLRLSEVVLNTKKLQGPQGEQGLQGPKGEQGDRGFDGANGKDGSNGKDGKDGEEGKQGVGVADAKIDFDGSLVITLTDGTEINAGDVVPMDTAEKIRVIGNGGGTSQYVLDAIEAINAVIDTYGTIATQDADAVAITGGTIDSTTIGGTTPAAGTFTTLTATGQTSLGGVAGSESFRAVTNASGNIRVQATAGIFGTSPAAIGLETSAGTGATLSVYNGSQGAVAFHTSGISSTQQLRVTHTASAVNYVQVTGAATSGYSAISAQGSDTNTGLYFQAKGTTGSLRFSTNGANSNEQFRVSNTSSAVNYVQVTGAATSGFPTVKLSALGSDSNIGMAYTSKGTFGHYFYNSSGYAHFAVNSTTSTAAVNYLQATGAIASSSPNLSAQGTDTNIDLTLTPKGTGNVRFGTYTANMALVIQGYIEIKDSGGTVRKLAVIA